MHVEHLSSMLQLKNILSLDTTSVYVHTYMLMYEVLQCHILDRDENGAWKVQV